jgi:hypothetical protein
MSSGNSLRGRGLVNRFRIASIIPSVGESQIGGIIVMGCCEARAKSMAPARRLLS